MSLDRINVAVLALVGAVALTCWGTRPFVGDGEEYFSMLFDVAEFHVPWSTPESRAFYFAYRRDHPELALRTSLWRRHKAFLTRDGRMDMPHFWMYSALAAPFYLALAPFGASAGYAFTLLHLALLAGLVVLARRRLGPDGATVALLLVLCSPAVWYVDKAHTEFFTVVVSIAAVVLLVTGAPVASAACFALLGTQNPPFDLIALPVLVVGLLDTGCAIPARRRLAATAGVVALVALHPSYYLVRLGVPTPQLLNGGISGVRFGLREMTAALVDPDLGLFANWWTGTGLLALAAGLLAWGHRPPLRGTLRPALLLAWAFIVVTWATAKTANFNHGGTVSVSRYALWYIMFFYPIACWVWCVGCARPGVGVGCLAIVLGLAVQAWIEFWPLRLEHHCTPTPVSRVVYRDIPFLYDPLPEVFVERRLPTCEQPVDYPVVSNPECTKILIYRDRLPAPPDTLGYVAGCERGPLDLDVVTEWARLCFRKRPHARTCYLNVFGSRRREVFRHPVYRLGWTMHMTTPAGTRFLGPGWYRPESWGTWSAGHRARLSFVLEAPPSNGRAELVLSVQPFVAGRRTRQRVRVRLNGHPIGAFVGRVLALEEHRIVFPRALLRPDNTLAFSLPDATSPAALGVGDDGRILGLGLVSFTIR